MIPRIDDLLTTSDARQRYGLTATDLEHVRPDRVRPNPVVPMGPRMRLYRASRLAQLARDKVEAQPPPVLIEPAKPDPRELRLTMRWPETADELRSWALAAMELWHKDQARPPGVQGIVAAVRHWGTTYDDVCVHLRRRRMDGERAYRELRARVDGLILAEIARRYPELT